LRYTNPVHDDYFADPFVWRHAGEYFAVGTGRGEADRDGVFTLLSSPDLVSWRSRGKALSRPDPGLGDTFWAPEIAFDAGIFYLYYSVGHGDRGHRLRVATSAAPAGPYRDSGRDLTDPQVCGFAIDPHPFRDDDGRWYLFYARDFLDSDGGARPGTALVVQRLEQMTRLTGQETVVLRARHEWQRFQRDRPMYGGVYDWHTLEGPSVCKRDGRYYCFYSGGRWDSANYGVDYGVADHVLGPYVDGAQASGPRILRSVPERVLGPGHNSLVVGPDGQTSYVVYHAWDSQRSARRMCLDPLLWRAEGPLCLGPSFTAQPLR
jgi:GH43 family beta-xylosidase